MSIGKTILNVRKGKGMSQEEFGELFHVTRQTVSNWENEKSYPDLNTLVTMSDMFEISLDKLLKGDKQMVKAMDKERLYGKYYKHQQSIIDFFTGAGTGLVISCCISPDSIRRTVIFCIGIAMFFIGAVRKLRWDKDVVKYLEKQEKEQ